MGRISEEIDIECVHKFLTAFLTNSMNNIPEGIFEILEKSLEVKVSSQRYL